MKTISYITLCLCIGLTRGFVSPRPCTTPRHHATQHQQPTRLSRHAVPILSLSIGGNLDTKTPVGKRKKLQNKTIIGSIALGLLAITSSSAVAHAAKKTVEAASPALILPTTSSLVLACVLPTLLGFYKSEYGVSYGYGTAIAASSYLVLSSLASASGVQLVPSAVTPSTIVPAIQSFFGTLKSLTSSLPAFHATSLLFYGTRLDLFLLYRELCLPRFRAMRERIEDRAKKQGSRAKRTPFIASCAFLYYCMMCPLLITSKLCEGMPMCGLSLGGSVPLFEQILRVLVGLTWSGFLLGAIGDLNKSLGKLMKGEDALITGGVFRFFRHPNYTGEVIGWVSSCLAAFTAVAWKSAKGDGMAVWKSQTPYLLMSMLGAAGITFVLGTATAGLEFRQNEKYGDTEEYKNWTKKSWVGFTMGKRKETTDDNQDNDDSSEKSSE